MKVTIEELIMFSAIVQNQSMTRAADRLNTAPSVLSRRLKALEHKLNCCLLQRTTRSITLTQEGQWLLSKSAGIIAGLEEVETYFLEEKNEPAGIIKVDAATPFTLHGLVPLISGFNQRYPEITVMLESSESIINLIDRKVDVALRIGELDDSSLKARKLGDTTRKIYASSDYIKRFGYPKKIDDLAQHTCLGFSKPNKLNTWPLSDANNQMLTVTPKIYADSGETLRQLALQGNGIVCLSAFTVKQDLENGLLMPLFEHDLVEIKIPVYLVYYSDKAVSGRVRCFIDYVIEHIDLQD